MPDPKERLLETMMWEEEEQEVTSRLPASKGRVERDDKTKACDADGRRGESTVLERKGTRDVQNDLQDKRNAKRASK